MAKLNLLKRDSLIVKTLAERNMVLRATCQISKIDKHTRYTNIAIQKINIVINNIEYHIDHLWLQGRDYPSYFIDMAVEGQWYDIEFMFYKYRDKINVNDQGITMHGIDILDVWEFTDEKTIAKSEEVFSQIPTVRQFNK